MSDKKNIMMVNGGMCLIVGGTMYIAFQLPNITVPLAAIISCGVCLTICGLRGMIK